MDPPERYPILSTLTSPLRRSPQQTIAGAVRGLLARTRCTLPPLAVQLAGRSGLQVARALTRLDRLLHHPRLDDGPLTRQLRWVRGQAQQRDPHAIVTVPEAMGWATRKGTGTPLKLVLSKSKPPGRCLPMKIVTIRPPRVKAQPEGRPKECPHCGSEDLHRHGSSTKPATDHERKQVVVHRYRWTQCQRTFSYSPEGVGRPDQSQRLIVLAAVAWALGLSTRAIEWLFEKLDARIGKSTALRDVRAVSEGLKGRLRRPGLSARVLGLDGTGIKIRSQGASTVVAVDLGSGQPIRIARVSEADLEALVAWLQPLVKAYGVEVIVTAERSTDGLVSTILGLKHGHCRFYRKRRVSRLIRAFEAELGAGRKPLLAAVKRISAELPQDGGKRLLNLALAIDARFDPRKEIQRPLYRLKQFIVRLSEHWSRYRLWLLRPEVPSTKNATEQVIGRLKVRARTVRGLKTVAGVESALLLTCARVA